jgi:MoaA/NifB/PqqE/SkfB family radical SAM enzyme
MVALACDKRTGMLAHPMSDRLNYAKRLMYSPFLVQMVVTRRCNLSCGYCNEFDEVSPPVPREVLERRIDKVHELGAWELEFTGGEPLVHPDLFDLVAYAAKKRFRRVMLISNSFLMTEEKVKRLNDAGLTDLQVSIDGVKPNDVTVKVLKPLRPKLEVLAKHAKFRIVLNGVVGSAPPAEVREVMEFAKTHGFVPRVGLLHGHDGQMQLSDEQLALYKDIKQSIGTRYNEAHDYRSKLVAGEPAPFKCRAGSRYFYVDEHGIVRWCSQTFDGFGIPLEKFTYEDMRKQFYTVKTCADHCTVGCVRTCSRLDEWRGQTAEPDPAYARVEPIFRISPRPPSETVQQVPAGAE